QEFKIWQVLHNLEFRNKDTKEKFIPDAEAKKVLFEELNIKGNLPATKIIEILGYKPKEWELNYKELEGNRTNKALYDAYLKIMDLEGYDSKDQLKVSIDKDEVEFRDLTVTVQAIKQMIQFFFDTSGIDSNILYFNAE